MSALKIRQWAWPFIKNFRTYIDVGALDGDTTKPFINDFKKVIAFEPNPEQYKLIPESIEKYKFRLGLSSIKLSPEKTLKKILSTVTVESKNVSQLFEGKLNNELKNVNSSLDPTYNLL